MKSWHLALIGVLIVATLAGCGGETSSSAAEQENAGSVSVNVDESGAYTSAALDTSSAGALPASSQLALGTLRLEEAEKAVTPEQAKALLPLWQAIQGGALQGDAETNTVLKQIEGAMTSEQLAAIAAMQLTAEDLQTWAQEQGVSLGLSPEALATRQTKGGGQGASEEEMATRQAMRESGDFGQGSGLSEEDRAARRATAEASGMTLGGRRFSGGAGQLTILVEPLIELLAQRAAS